MPKTYFDLVKEELGEKYRDVLLVLEDNNLRELNSPVKEGAYTRYLTIEDVAGAKAYRRGLSLLMLSALRSLHGDDDRYDVVIHYVVSDGLYCSLKDPSVLTDEFIAELDAKMVEIVSDAKPIIKHNIRTDDARKLFNERHMYDKEQLFKYRTSSRTNVYELDGYIDYFYGYMLHDASQLSLFALQRYDDGFVLRYPSARDSDSLSDFKPDKKLYNVQKMSRKWGESQQLCDVGDLNDRIVAGESKQLILIQEAYHEHKIASIAQQIADDPDKKLIMIAGPSSSGKTTFSYRLSTQLSVHGLHPHPIAVDDYFVDREKTPRHPDGSYNFECLEAIDVEQFNKDMNALIAGEEIELPSFNFKTGKREYKGRRKKLGKGDVLVIEGIHGLNDALSYSLPRESKYKIYISALTQLSLDEHNRIATTDGRLLRRIVRDARTRGTKAADTIMMWPSVRSGEEQYIFPFQESCDVMFNSALIYELAVLKIYAQPLLFGIDRSEPAWLEANRLLKFLDYIVPMAPDDIPMNSLVREFIGGSCFEV